MRQHGRQTRPVQLEGRHAPAKNGGAAVGYQGRKAARTTNTLFLADNTDQPLAVAMSQAGNYHDTSGLGLGRVLAELCDLLAQAGLSLDSVFLNADKAFDTSELRQACAACSIEANIAHNWLAADWQTDDDTLLDPKLYRRRLVIEQMNA